MWSHPEGKLDEIPDVLEGAILVELLAETKEKLPKESPDFVPLVQDNTRICL